MQHIPVLLEEVMTALSVRPGGRYIDATLGDGGHAEALLQESQPDGHILGLEQDAQQLAIAKERLKPYGRRATLVQARFSRLEEIARQEGFTAVDGVLLDLGISSRQLASPAYGLGFDEATPLDMRLSSELPYTAADFLNRANETEIADVLYRFGDRHNSRTLAKKIIAYRRKKAFQVAYDLKSAIDLWRPAQLAPVFQALRIWVNREYEELEAALPAALAVLKSGGVLAVITFHSGEDRIVKHFLREHRELLGASPRFITPSYREVQKNPRSRSAKLRIATKK